MALNYYIFRCSDETYEECHERMLFGQSVNYQKKVAEVKLGDIIFLHKVRKRGDVEEFLEGPFFATSNGSENIVVNAWNKRFPMQVKVEKRGKLAQIKRENFKFFGLNYKHDDHFFEFKINNELGRKLMNEMGFEMDFEEKSFKNFNPVENIEIDYRLKYPAELRCDDGHYVRSRGEALIDNWLFNNNIVHAYEKKIPGQNIISDFCVKNKKNQSIYIEYWGLNTPEYNKRKNSKEEIYSKNNLILVSITDSQINNLSDYLSDKMAHYDVI